MDQIEVKKYIVEHLYHPGAGWSVTVHVDPMEKLFSSWPTCQQWFVQNRITTGEHPEYGKTDIVAERGNTTEIVEAEGNTSKQKSNALYDALGQLLLQMKKRPEDITYVLAFPDKQEWERQLDKLSPWLCDTLHVQKILVSKEGCRSI